MTLQAARIHASRHDQSQIELDLDYPLPSGARQQDCRHLLDLYFFLPSSLGISAASYSRDQFYNDLTNYLRFHTPVISGSALGLLDRLPTYFQPDLTLQARERLVPYLIQQVKLFGNRINTGLKRVFDSMTKNSVATEFQLRREVEVLRQDIHAFRAQWVSRVRYPKLGLDDELRKTLLNVDEFLINRQVAVFSNVLESTSHQGERRDLRQLLLEILDEETTYRSAHAEQYVGPKKSETEIEYFYYRHGLLKKFLARPLHIQKRAAKQERVYRNWVAGLGAGLAGLWARIAETQATRMSSARDLGLNVFTVGTLFVLIYVFKDRIKDISKEYFSEVLKTHLPDYRVALRYDWIDSSLSNRSVELGAYRDFVRYLSPQTCPDDIVYLRKLKGRRDIGEEHLETVLHYNKALTVRNASLLGDIPGITALKDMIRLNFTSFFDHMDDPQKRVSVYDQDEGTAQISAPKVYHINLVCRLRSFSEGETISYAHFRLVIDKSHVVRIEEVTAQRHVHLSHLPSTPEGLQS